MLIDGNQYVPDSWEIAKHLEDQVPEPTIFPGGIGMHEAFQNYVMSELQPNVLFWILPQIPAILDTRGAEYFTRTREATFGCSLEEKSKGGDGKWLPILKKGIVPIYHALRESGAHICGKDFGYADVIIFSLCQWFKRADPTRLVKFFELDSDGQMESWYKRCQLYYPQLD